MTRVEIQKDATQTKLLYIFIAKSIIIKGESTKDIFLIFFNDYESMGLEARVMGNIWCSMLMENHYTYVVIHITCDCNALVLE